MVKFICGEKGTGKSKKLIVMANEHREDINGDIVFIEAGQKHMFDLHRNIRFINAMEFDIEDIESFHGFLCGVIANNYDIEKVFVDGLYEIFDLDFKIYPELINKLEKISDRFNTDFILTMSNNPKDVPEELRKYILKQ